MIRTLLIEPFYGGSHAQLVDLLVSRFKGSEGNLLELITMSGKKWHWRARTSALWLSFQIPKKKYDRIFITSVVNLAELIGLRSDLSGSEKILYFHENQLEYPTRDPKQRDFQYGYNQILSALVADKVIFNSDFNLRSFLAKLDPFLNQQPDYHTQCRDLIASKCSVLHYPLTVERVREPASNAILHIVWPHRWEHDKGPEEFFAAMEDLRLTGSDFKILVLGQVFDEVPAVFEQAQSTLSAHIVRWGHVESKEEFLGLLRRSDVVVSTALHEFYGVSVLEAAFQGAFPLVPNRLSYPDLFPKICIYNTRAQLVKRLREFCRKPSVPREMAASLDLDRYHWNSLKPLYRDLLLSPVS